MTKPTETPPHQLGARQVRAVMISLMGSVVLAALTGGTPLMGAVFWIAVLGFLWLSMSRGRGWARWVVIAISAVLGVGNAYPAITSFGAEGYAWAIHAGLVVVYAWCIFVLVLSDKVAAYLVAGRERAEDDKPRQ